MRGDQVGVVRRLGHHGDDRAGLRVGHHDRSALAVRDEVEGELLDFGVEREFHGGTLGLVAQEELADPVQELLVRAARELLVH